MHIPKIPNAFENIKIACEQRLSELYPYGVPELVTTRYQKELEFLKNSEYLDDFEILRCLQNEAAKCSQFLSIRGTTTNSYIVYLLSRSLLNPLPTHYYCPSCGYFEIVDTKLFGIDLPDSKCPKCQHNLIADGFNLSSEMVWGIGGKKIMSFDYNISREFFPFAKRILQSLYPNNVIAPLGLFNRPPSEKDIEIAQSGFLILPDGQTIDDYPEMIAYLEDGELCLSGNILEVKENYLKRVLLLQHRCVEQLIALQRKTGLYANEITLQNLRTINWNDINNTTALTKAESFLYHDLKPKTFYHMSSYMSACHNSYSNNECSPYDGKYYSIPDLFRIPEFEKYPCYTRDDFFDELLKMNLDLEKAFEISELIRKGIPSNKSSKHLEKFESFDLPEEFKTVAKQYRYLFPRSHTTEYLLLYARLAFYAKIDSRIFSKIIYKQKN